MLRWSVLALVLASLPAVAGGAQDEVVGWAPHPFFTAEDAGARIADLPLHLYPEGQSEKHWAERVVVHALKDHRDARTALDTMAAQQRETCPDYAESRMKVPKDRAQVLAITMWHCPRNAKGRGEVGTRVVHIAGDTAYAMTAQGDYPAFAPGKTPLMRAQLERWYEMQLSFATCGDWTAALGCAPSPDALMTAEALTQSPDEARALARIEARAAAMYRQDQIAWRGTDFAVKEKLVDRKRAAKDDRFIAVEEGESGGALYFTRGRGKKPRIRAAVRADDGGRWSAVGKLRALPAEAQRRYAALRAVLDDVERRLCSENVNFLVLPSEQGEGWLVYVMSATLTPSQVWIGGHTRYEVARDGRVRSRIASATSCLALSIDPELPKGVRDAALTVTHIVSPKPTEFHVFESLTFGVPIVVVTADSAWRIEAGRIAKLAID